MVQTRLQRYKIFMKEMHKFQILTINNISPFPVIKVKVIKGFGGTEYIYNII